MAQSTFSIRMDEDTKRKFAAFCDEVGMTPSTAFTLFAKKVVREQRIPFTIGIDEPNAETYAAIESDDLYGPFDSVAQMMEALNA